jgi:hypothetical protein
VETSFNTQHLRWAAYASIGAGVVHGAAMGLHAEHPTLSLIFMAFTLLQVGWGIVVLSNQQRWVLVGGCLVNTAAVAGWVVTRFAGISFISGLEIAEKPQPADSFGALLAAVSIAAMFFVGREQLARKNRRSPFNAATLCGVFTFLALLSVAGTVHEHGEFVPLADSNLSISADGVIVSPTTIVRALDVTTSLSTQTTTSVATTATTIAPKTSRSTTTTTQEMAN